MKTITVLSQGNASSSKTWSNIPYYLVETLKQKGLNVHTIDIDSNGIGRFIYDKIFCRLLRHTLLPQTTYSYDRTSSFQKCTKRKLEGIVSQFPDTDIFISTSFSFHPKRFTKKTCILLCDWNYEYLISHFMNREPDSYEKKGIEIQDSIISEADLVISLFPDVASHMAGRYPDTKVVYLGNVINALPFDLSVDGFSNRFHNPHIVFVGLSKYMEGLESLIKAVESINAQGINLGLDVIGMEASDMPTTTSSFVRFHGYLEKSNPVQLEKYDSIMKSSLAFINTTPVWAGFSSTLEAMYYGLPIYTSKYSSFVDTFGETIDFGGYSMENTPSEIEVFIKGLLNSPFDDYTSLCLNARKEAEPFTWSAYVDKLLSTVIES